MKILIKNIIISIVVLSASSVVAQDVAIKLGPNNIAKNQQFTITAVVKNGNISKLSDFPNIQGFKKGSAGTSSSMNIVNGRMSSEYKYTQNYIPTKEGKFVLKAFKLSINGKTATSQGTTITVGPPVQQRRRRSLFDDFFGNSGGQQQSREFVDVQDDAFFAVMPNKYEIYEGEGVTLTAAFYVAKGNRAPLEFYRLDEQIPEIMEKIKPKSAWEEKNPITQISEEIVDVNGKKYSKYVLIQSTYYPLNAEDLVVPAIGLKMVKYKVAKQRSFWGNNHQADYKTYQSKAKRIKVKPLPPHPLKDVVSVGYYKLKDAISTDKFETGKSFNYQFKIGGEGNISAIKEPRLNESDMLEIYPPNEHQNISNSKGRVTGSKLFDYYIIPSEPGNADLSKTFEWIYFNTVNERYDTLRSDIVLNILGESKKNSTILSNDVGNFYNRIPNESNELINLRSNDSFYFWMEILIGLIGVATIVLVFIKRQS